MALTLLVPAPVGGQFLVTCAEDAKIEAGKRKAVEQTSMEFVQFLLRGDSNAAYRKLTLEAQATLTREQFENLLTQAIQPFAPLQGLRVTKTYFVHVRGSSPIRAICGDRISRPEGWASVAANDSPEQVHVLIEGQARNNIQGFALWLLPEGGEWRVHSFFFNAVSLTDKRAQEVWNLARSERAHGHLLNAVLLYAAASQLASPGPTIQPGILQAIQEETKDLQIPQEIQGQPPFVWKAARKEFHVLNLGPIAIAGDIYLRILHEVDHWKSEDEAELQNRELMTHFVARFPEYSHVFAGLVVQARERGGNRMWGTVEDLRKK